MKPQQGARFEVHIEKARTLVGDGAVPFEALVESFVAKTGKPGIRWLARDLKPSIYAQAVELFAEGKTVRQVKAALGISHGEAGRLRLRAAAEGALGGEAEDEDTEAEIAPDAHSRLN